MVAGGIALIPGGSLDPPATTAIEPVLPAPELATTSTTLPAASVAVMSDNTVSLTPTAGLEGFLRLTRPVAFNGRHWIVGNHGYPSADATVLSSLDGNRWEAEAVVSAAEGGWLRIDDIGTFGGVLMAVGTEGSDPGPAYAPPTAGALVLWKSIDGRRWSSLTIKEGNGQEYGALRLTAGPEEVLINGYHSTAFDESLLDQIPADLVSGIESGDFSLSYDPSTLRVIAPPGIELFVLRDLANETPGGSGLLFRSQNLIIWEQPVIDRLIRNVATTPDGGFVSYDRGLLYSKDGRSWGQTDRYPSLSFQNWGDRLFADKRTSVTTDRLFVFGEGEASTIDLPFEIASSGEVSLTPGAAGVAALQELESQILRGPITRVDGYILARDNQVLRIEEPSGESTYARFDRYGLIEGTYLAEADSIRFESANGSKTYEFPVQAFLDLRGRPWRGRFDIFVSADGLVWSRAQTGIRAARVEVLGSTDAGFLIAVHNLGTDSRPLPITVYKTGPAG